MSRPKLLDLFCGAGGAAWGYYNAGFDVVGIDKNPQKNFPFPFIQKDVMDVFANEQDWIKSEFDAVHASPPCQTYSIATHIQKTQANHDDLVAPVRDYLWQVGLPWVLENVPEAPTDGITLCGSQFGLKVQRHRRFETSFTVNQQMPSCVHDGLIPFNHKAERAYADAMGCTWMNKIEARQSIPPVYAEFMGTLLIKQIIEPETPPAYLSSEEIQQIRRKIKSPHAVYSNIVHQDLPRLLDALDAAYESGYVYGSFGTNKEN